MQHPAFPFFTPKGEIWFYFLLLDYANQSGPLISQGEFGRRYNNATKAFGPIGGIKRDPDKER